MMASTVRVWTIGGMIPAMTTISVGISMVRLVAGRIRWRLCTISGTCWEPDQCLLQRLLYVTEVSGSLTLNEWFKYWDTTGKRLGLSRWKSVCDVRTA